MKPKLPEITLQDWLDAEMEVVKEYPPPPAGSVTIAQYAQLRGRSETRSSYILRMLFHKGRAERTKCSLPDGGTGYAYTLKK